MNTACFVVFVGTHVAIVFSIVEEPRKNTLSTAVAKLVPLLAGPVGCTKHRTGISRTRSQSTIEKSRLLANRTNRRVYAVCHLYTTHVLWLNRLTEKLSEKRK